jgi:hypothetical protein
VRVIGCADSTVFDSRADCTTRADCDSNGYAVCFDSCTHTHNYPNVYEDGNTNMDKYAYPDNDPDITTDKDGHAWIHVNGRAYRYEYADTSGAGLDEDSGDADAAVAKFRLIGTGNSGPDPDCNGNA